MVFRLFVISLLLASPLRAQAGCVDLLEFGAQDLTAAAAVNLSPAELKARIPKAAEVAFDKLAEQGVDFSRLENILNKDWLVSGGVLTEDKIHSAFSGTTQYSSMLYRFLVEVEKKLLLQTEIVMEIREAVLAGLRARTMQEGAVRAEAQAEVQRVRSIRFSPTSLGHVFKPVDDPMMGKSVKDPDELIWSERLPENYKNDGPVKNGIITDSEATRACEAIGARLPTREDYKKLRDYFERDESDQMTAQGLTDFHHLFPDMLGRFFWSSTRSVYLGASDGVYTLRGDVGIIFTDDRNVEFAYGDVRCVRSP